MPSSPLAEKDSTSTVEKRDETKPTGKRQNVNVRLDPVTKRGSSVVHSNPEDGTATTRKGFQSGKRTITRDENGAHSSFMLPDGMPREVVEDNSDNEVIKENDTDA